MAKKKADKDTGLTLRQRNLLFAVVKEYCEFGNTVSSHDLKSKYGFDISPATIRNEFTQLRKLGYLYQPFTNSSSQPTEQSFKLFINQLITNLQTTSRQQNDMRQQIVNLQLQQVNLQKEISKLLALETEAVGFAVNMKEENIAGIKNLLAKPNSEQVTNILDFLENLDQHKKYLLEHKKEDNDQDYSIAAIFGGDNPVLPLGKGFAMVATEAIVNNEKTVFGIITQPHILGRKKTLQILNSISTILNENNED
jgi:transcriptional regulator of heat shock response